MGTPLRPNYAFEPSVMPGRARRERPGALCARGARPASSRGPSTRALGTRVVTAFSIAGLVLFGLSLWAWRQNRRVMPQLPPKLIFLWKWRWALGLALAVGDYFIQYHADGGGDHYTVHGFPIMAYAFDQRGFDYVGAITLPAILLNAAIFLLMPHLFIWVYGMRERWASGGPSA